MTTKNLVILAGVAVAIGAAAYLTSGNNKKSVPQLAGKSILPTLDLSAVASIEVGDKIKLSAGEEGWVIGTAQDYPADRGKIANNLLRLTELKVGQVARGRALGEVTPVVLKDAGGKILAEVMLGDKHMGRYVGFDGSTVLVKDTLDCFDGEIRDWCDTHIVDKPYVSFNRIADANLTEADLGFATGKVYTVSRREGTNDVDVVAHIGNTVKGGSDRYLKLDGSRWIFEVPSYAADSLERDAQEKIKKAEEAAKKAAEAEAAAKKAAEEAKNAPTEAKSVETQTTTETTSEGK